MRRSLTLKSKIILLTGVLLTLFIGSLLGGMWTLHLMYKIEKEATAILHIQDEFEELRINFEQSLMGLHNYLIHGNKDEVRTFKSELENLWQKKNMLTELIIKEKERVAPQFRFYLSQISEILREIERKFPLYEEISKKILSFSNPIGNPQAGKYMKEMDSLVRDIESSLQKSADILLELVQQIKDKIYKIHHQVFIIWIGAGGIVGIIGIIFATSIVRGITHPIKDLLDAVKEVEGGNLQVQAKVRTEDEIGRLAQAFNKMLKELIVAQEKVLNIFNASGDAIRVIDKDFNILQVNEEMCKLIGLPRKEIVGKKCYEVFGGEFCNTSECTYKKILKGEPRIKVETYKRRPDGHIIPVELIATPLKVEGNIVSVIESFRDITLRKKIEKELIDAKEKAEAATEAKSRFLASMSHEIRTPMNSILGFADLLMQEELTESQKEFVRMIKESGEVLLNLINDILDLSKIEAGKIVLENRVFELKSLVKEALELVRFRIEAKNLFLKVIYSEDLPTYVRGDPFRIKQILLNILSNAIKFTEHGGITVEVRKISTEDNRVNIQFSIKDTGIGIAKDKQEKIFDAFAQAESSTTRKYGGTGLGLAISKKLVELMKGKIWVESLPGRGSCFYVLLPLELSTQEESQIQEEKERKEEEALRVYKENPLVLLVEDDAKTQELFQRYLIKNNFRLISTPKGKEALELAKKYHPDLIVLDLLLPDKDGFSVLKELKADKETEEIPVVICSILSEKEKAVSLGAIDYLEKPVNEKKFIERIRKILPYKKEIYTILVIDDEKATIDYVKVVLKEGNYKVIGFTSPKKALDFVNSGNQQIDLIILDLLMPEMDGFTVLNILKSNKLTQTIPVLIFTVKKLTEEDYKKLNSFYASLLNKSQTSPSDLISEVERILEKEYSLKKEMSKPEVSPVEEKDIILLVEDNPVNQKLMDYILKKEGFKYELAVDGEEAVNKAKEKNYSLILMDVLLPKMDGLTATRKIREFPHHKNTPIIALTAQAMKGDEEKCLEAGCNSYITKPINREKLISEIKKYMKKKEESFFDEDFKLLQKEFIDYVSKKLKEMKEHLTQGNFKEIVFFGHGLKGAGATYGYPVFSSLGELIEKEAMSNHSEELKNLFSQLETELSKLDNKDT